MTFAFRVILAACCALLLPTAAVAGGKSVHVRGYTRKDGTVVAPYTRTASRSAYRGGAAISVPDFFGATVPRDVPVKGHYRADGTYVNPHMRHIDGIKNPESSGSGRGSKHRTSSRTTAKGLAKPTKPKTRYPARDWKSSSGEVLAHGRMGWKAMGKLHVEKDDGTFVDLRVDDLSEGDANWLEAAQKRPWAMKTDVVEHAEIEEAAADQEAEAEGEAMHAETTTPE